MKINRDIINFKVLSQELTGSETKIRKQNTAEKYSEDVDELLELIETWAKWKRKKYKK
jgi:hypothetical protein